MLLESAVMGFKELDKSIFQGRLLDVLPSKQPPPTSEKLPTKGTAAAEINTFKQKMEDQKNASETNSDTRARNFLFVRLDTIAEDVAKILLLEGRKMKRSNHVLPIKKLPISTSEADLVQMLGSLERGILRLTQSMVLAVYLEAAEARVACNALAYKRYKHVPLYLKLASESIMAS